MLRILRKIDDIASAAYSKRLDEAGSAGCTEADLKQAIAEALEDAEEMQEYLAWTAPEREWAKFEFNRDA